MNTEALPEFRTVSAAWNYSLERVTGGGAYTEDDGKMLLEVLGLHFVLWDCALDATIMEVADPARISLMERKYSSLAAVSPYTKSYGALFRDLDGVNQIDKAIKRIEAKRSTKSATITFHRPNDDELSCISMMDFKIRDETLHTLVVYRSQNIFASQPGNIAAVGALIFEVATRTGCRVGPTEFHVASAHIYEDDLASAWTALESLAARLAHSTKASVRVEAAQRIVSQPSLPQIADEWNKIAESRHNGILRGEDLSYDHVIVPTLINLIQSSVGDPRSISHIVDAGCGTGLFAKKLVDTFASAHVHGVDPSGRSIAVANALNLARCEFVQATIEEVADEHNHESDVMVANMLLQNVPDLDSALNSMRSLVRPGGILAFALPHPCFWPRYWGYDRLEGFSYWEENWISSPFRTSMKRQAESTTHAHRPLGMYFEAFRRAGFELAELTEPRPPSSLDEKYKHSWLFPRFLLGVLTAPA